MNIILLLFWFLHSCGIGIVVVIMLAYGILTLIDILIIYL